MIEDLRWHGDHNGHVVLAVAASDGNPAQELIIDRPGDMAVAIIDGHFTDEDLMCVAAVFGVCLATRGCEQPAFIRDIILKSIAFMNGANAQSLRLYRTMARLKDLVAAQAEADGFALRDELFREAHALRSGWGGG